MKALAVAVVALSLILLFWAVLVLVVVSNSMPSLNLALLPLVFDLIKTVCAVIAAGVAIYALTTWRRTLKAQKRTEFLDQYLSSVLELCGILQENVGGVMSVKFRVESTGGDPCSDDDSRRLDDLTSKTYVALGKVNAFTAKGEVFKFHQYEICRNAIAGLARTYTRLGLQSSILKFGYEVGPFDAAILIESQMVKDTEYRERIDEQKNILIGYVSDRYSEMHG